MSRSLLPAATIVAVILGATAVLSTCQSPQSDGDHAAQLAPVHDQAPADVLTTPPDPIIDWGGCTTVLTGLDDHALTCVYSQDQPLRLWVQHPDVDETRITVDDQPIEPTRRELEFELGQGFDVIIDHARAQTIRVELPGADPWSLRVLAEARLDPTLVAAREALRAHGGELQERLGSGEPGALLELRRTVHRSLSLGLLHDTVVLALGASYFLNKRPSGSRAALQVLRALADATRSRYPWGYTALTIYRARLLRQRGRSLEAILEVRDASRFVRRLDHGKLQIDGLTEYAYLLARLGYPAAAARWSAHALELGRTRGSKSVPMLLDMVATTNLQLKRIGLPHDDPVPHYEKILTTARESGSSTGIAMAHARLAEVALLDGDLSAAADHLDALERADLFARAAIDAATVDLQLHLALGSAPAVLDAKLQALERSTRTVVDPSVEWRISVSRGQVHEALGEHDDAIADYELSERQLDTILPLAALGIGGGVLSDRYLEGTEHLLAALLFGPAPRPADALCVARRAQARLSRLPALLHRSGRSRERILREAEDYLDAKADYEQLQRDADEFPVDQLERAMQDVERLQLQLQRRAQDILSSGEASLTPTCDELPRRRSGELLLDLFPLGSDLLVFVADDHGVSSQRWPAEARPRIAKDLLATIDEQLRRATRIRVVATGEATELPLHAFDWNGAPLGVERPVVYGLELPLMNELEPSTRAIVLADTQADGATAAARAAARRLGTLEYLVELFDTDSPEGATVRGRLGGAAHFLYAGHAYLASADSDDSSVWPPYPGGSATEPSYLPLDEFARLDVADILMIHPAPRLAVLLGCETGATRTRTTHAGHSLATGFISAGTEAVIATTRAVRSDDAWKVSRALYDLPASLHDDPGRWMQRALTDAVGAGLSPQVLAHFRVFVR